MCAARMLTMSDLLDQKRVEDLLKLCRSVPDYSIQSLVAEFLKSTASVVLQIQQNKNEVDAENMPKLLHALKGASMTIGAARLLDLSKQAEALSKKKVDGSLPDVIDKISKTYEETKLALLQLS